MTIGSNLVAAASAAEGEKAILFYGIVGTKWIKI
jgi:hypothetical protein